jgi:hypothetical protein
MFHRGWVNDIGAGRSANRMKAMFRAVHIVANIYETLLHRAGRDRLDKHPRPPSMRRLHRPGARRGLDRIARVRASQPITPLGRSRGWGPRRSTPHRWYLRSVAMMLTADNTGGSTQQEPLLRAYSHRHGDADPDARGQGCTPADSKIAAEQTCRARVP